MSTAKHTVSSFDADLNLLKDHLLQMGELVDRAFVDAVHALLTRDDVAAAKVIEEDGQVDVLEARVEHEAIQIIARRQPLAVDLRDIMAAARIGSELERIGDLAKNIAKRAGALGSEPTPQDLAARIRQMSTLAQDQLRQVLAAYADRDAARAMAIRDADGEIDLLNTAFFKESIDYIARTYQDIAGTAHLLFCAKNIERIGDHVTNISENVYFIVTGTTPAEERTKLDTSSTLHPGVDPNPGT
jgi:phosphate transport system protein